MLNTLKYLRTLINIVSQGGSRKSCTFVSEKRVNVARNYYKRLN